MDSIFDDGFVEIGKQWQLPLENIIEYKIDVLIEQGSNSSVRYKYDETQNRHSFVTKFLIIHLNRILILASFQKRQTHTTAH